MFKSVNSIKLSELPIPLNKNDVLLRFEVSSLFIKFSFLIIQDDKLSNRLPVVKKCPSISCLEVNFTDKLLALSWDRHCSQIIDIFMEALCEMVWRLLNPNLRFGFAILILLLSFDRMKEIVFQHFYIILTIVKLLWN